MPWQAVPSLLIIVGAFNVTAFLLWGLEEFNPYKRQRMDRDQLQFILEQRDVEVLKYRKELARIEQEAKKNAQQLGTTE